MYKITYPFCYMQDSIEKGEGWLKRVCLEQGESELSCEIRLLGLSLACDVELI